MSTRNHKPFSVRHGYQQPKSIQHESIDADLRAGLWNVLHNCFQNSGFESHFIFEIIWAEFLKEPLDADDYDILMSRYKDYTKDIFLSSEWHRVFDLIEFVISFLSDPTDQDTKRRFIDQCNQTLEQENSAYKIVGGRVVEITAEQEIESIENAMVTPHDGANGHIKNALSLFSRRENPDYRNSIKESISAVESITKEITGQGSFSVGVDKLEKHGIKLHGAHRSALKKLYGFTSDADGIRHASTNNEPLDINRNTARFMLIACSAFVNYIISQNE